MENRQVCDASAQVQAYNQLAGVAASSSSAPFSFWAVHPGRNSQHEARLLQAAVRRPKANDEEPNPASTHQLPPT
jgi:hypothetical protein